MNHTLFAQQLLSNPKAEYAEPIQDPEILAGYLQDASRLKGHASLLFRPSSECELARALVYCSVRACPVTVVARQTSTTGSSVPEGGAIVSMEKLASFVALDRTEQTATAEPGILLGDFQKLVEQHGLFYPPDPTSRNESTLGASVACNASGARTYKYGATRGYVIRIRIVLSSGHVVEIKRGDTVCNSNGEIFMQYSDSGRSRIRVPTYQMPNVKHAAGYYSSHPMDAIDLFIGSEGTLGVISEIEVRLLPRPSRVFSFLACWKDASSAVSFVKKARSLHRAGQLEPRCLEYFDAPSLQIIRQHCQEQSLPPSAAAAVFFEQECSEDDETLWLERWSTLLDEAGALLDVEGGVIIADTRHRTELLYEMRHSVPAGVNEIAARNKMPKIGTDLAVPDLALDQMLELYHDAVHDPFRLFSDEEALVLMCDVVGIALLDQNSPDFWESALAMLEHRVGAATGVALNAHSERLRRLWTAFQFPTRFEYALFGHIGNNHLHLNFLPKTPLELRVARRVYELLTRKAINLGGTVSGEHGIGKIKRYALRWMFGDSGISEMKAVKAVLDPAGILGVGNLFE